MSLSSNMMNSSADDDETLGWSEKAEDAFLEEYNVADKKWEPDDVSERSFITREDISVRSFMTGSLVTGSLLTGDEDVEKQPGKPSSDHTEGTQDEAAESDDDFPVHNVIQKKIRSINKLASCCVCWVLLLVLTAEVMVALVLFRLWRNPRDTTMESPSSSSYGDLPPYPSPILPTQTTRSPTSVLSTPTPSMVVVPTTEAFRTRRQKLIRLSPSSEEALFLSSSAQYRALEWLTFESNYTSYSSSEDRVVQRWVMATIFYSLRGRRWTRSDNWLGEMHECDWFSVDPTKYCDENGNVVGIYLSNNRLGGLIPDEISLLSNHLAHLFLKENVNITGTISTHLGRLSKLSRLQLAGGSIRGTIPDIFGNMTSLGSLGLGRNLIDGTIPSVLGSMVGLQSLGLEGNSITGTIPTELGKLTRLESLTLESNGLIGTVPSELSMMTTLKSLKINLNDLTGSVPTGLCDNVKASVLQVLEADCAVTCECCDSCEAPP